MVSLSRGTLIEVSKSQVDTVIRSVVNLLDGISRVRSTPHICNARDRLAL